MFAVTYGETPEAVAKLTKVASAWEINVIDDWDHRIANHYKISAIPHLFIIGRDGNVLANHIGYGDRSIDDLVNDLNKALSVPPSTDTENSSAKGAATESTPL